MRRIRRGAPALFGATDDERPGLSKGGLASRCTSITTRTLSGGIRAPARAARLEGRDSVHRRPQVMLDATELPSFLAGQCVAGRAPPIMGESVDVGARVSGAVKARSEAHVCLATPQSFCACPAWMTFCRRQTAPLTSSCCVTNSQAR